MLEAAATDPQNNTVGQSEKPKSPPYSRLSEEACDPLASSRGRIRELEDPLLERDAPKGTRRSSSAPRKSDLIRCLLEHGNSGRAKIYGVRD